MSRPPIRSSPRLVLLGQAGDDTINGVDGISANDRLTGGFDTDGCTADAGDVEVGCES